MRSLLSFKHINSNRAKVFLALLFSLLSIFVATHNASAQYTYFEKRIDLTGGYDKPLSIVETDTGYCIGTITQDTIYHYYWQIAFVSIDTLGNLTRFKQYGNIGDLYLLGNPGCLLKYNQNKYFAVGNILSFLGGDTINNRALIMCMDNNFDTLWTKQFSESIMPYDTQSVIFQIKKDFDNSLINIGGVMGNAPTRIWLLKTDTLGNKLWERFYGEGAEHFQGHSVVQTADGGYVIGGYKFKIGYNYTNDPIIIKTDSLGNEEWRLNPGNPNVGDNKVMVALAQDGNIIAGTNYGTEQSGDNRWAVVKIMKITPDGTVLWDKNYLEPEYDNFLLNTTVLNNDNIIVNGSFARFDDGPAIVSYIICIDSIGNQLWYKEYVLLTGHMSFNDLYDVRETPDGGLIGVGKVSPSVPDTGTNDIWIMKMDSMGCLFPGCDTTVVVEETALPDSFKLYPNPAKKHLVCEPKNSIEKETVFVIFNTLGIKVKEVKVPLESNKVQINISSLPNGIYMAALRIKGKYAGTRKFVIKK